jgi:imidazole glycerol-phosphate synthase subunit HisF
MLTTRVIPCLLLKGQGLVKTIKFKDPKYVGDPINAIRIFNEKEVDELIFLDITATLEKKRPNQKLISEIASECFMPLCYGGGIRTLTDIEQIFSLGVEKVALNSAVWENPDIITQAAQLFGSQSIVVSLDVKKNLWGKYEIYVQGGRKNTKLEPVIQAKKMADLGAGEILLNSIDRDGTRQGFDIDLIGRVAGAVNIPVIACGGAGELNDFAQAVKQGGASAVAAGSMFVLHGKHRAVLITYPPSSELKRIFAN